MSTAVEPVGQSPTQISLPPVRSVLVINSSEGIGDKPGAPNVVVNNSTACTLSPQVGCLLEPGQSVAFDLACGQLPLYAVASGPGAQVTLQLED